MDNIKILDCTLRDGGSLTNWIFGRERILNIFQQLNNAHIDIVELGFIDNNADENKESSLNSSNKYFDTISSEITDKICSSVAMIDLEKYDFGKFNFTESKNLNGIRVMFTKDKIKEAIEITEKLNNLNYKVSLNPVSVTSYSDSELSNLIKQVNNVKPERFYIVDTYGLMDINQTLKYFRLINDNLSDRIEIGYHSHNNLQLSFANAISIINENKNRNIVIDSSLYGMGKRAGNTPTELIANYLNNSCGKNYDINIINNIIETIILPLHNYFNWGYSMTHYLAAENKCHSDYVTYLRNEKKLSFSEITNILNQIPYDKKLKFDKNYLENFFS